MYPGKVTRTSWEFSA